MKKIKLLIFLFFAVLFFPAKTYAIPTVVENNVVKANEITFLNLAEYDSIGQEIYIDHSVGAIEIPLEMSKTSDGTLVFRVLSINDDSVIAVNKYDLNQVYNHLLVHDDFPFGFPPQDPKMSSGIKVIFNIENQLDDLEFLIPVTSESIVDGNLILNGARSESQDIVFNALDDVDVTTFVTNELVEKVSNQKIFFSIYLLLILVLVIYLLSNGREKSV